jgi:cytochrome o ubiquinol oxidase subunit 2
MSQRPLLRRAGWPLAALALSGCSKAVVLNPSGDIAAQQGQMVVHATLLMLIIIVPVIVLTLWFAWKYRQSNAASEQDYDPDWHHSTTLELVIWSVPLLIIIALGAMTWIGTHKLDPYRPLDRIAEGKPLDGRPPLEVQVVAMDWKWLFLYPEEGIATVNELAAPVDRPIRFRLTATSTMNAFYVPALAGMIYAMPGMQTELNAVINEPGVFHGMASHYSGLGFSGMTFKFHGLSEDGFGEWVAQARAAGDVLDRAAYLALARPSEREPVRRFARIEPDLYERILNRCVEDGQMCLHHMMAIDELGGRAYLRAQGIDLPPDMCTAADLTRDVAALDVTVVAPSVTARP